MKKRRENTVSLKDIARTAGVSSATVSAALNRTGRIGEKRRQEIIRIAEQLNYKPNAAAKLLKQKVCKDIGVILSNSGGDINVGDIVLPVIAGIAEFCTSRGVGSHLELFNYNAEGAKLPGVFTNGLAGGILHVGFVSARLLEYIKTTSCLPLVTLEESSPCQVLSDFAPGVRQAVRHLVVSGHRKIALLTGPREFRIQQEVFDHFLTAAKEYGIAEESFPFQREFLLLPNLEAVRFGVETAKEILAMPEKDRPTAAIVADGRIGRAIVNYMAERSVRIPEAFSLVSISSQRQAEQNWPVLTTVQSCSEKLVNSACEMLNSLMRGEQTAPQTIWIPTEFIVRNTTLQIIKERKDQ